jgi:hypothetical protein
MQRDAAGIATETPSHKRAAEIKSRQAVIQFDDRGYLQISHHTGAIFMTVVLKTIELMNMLRQPIAVQIM